MSVEPLTWLDSAHISRLDEALALSLPKAYNFEIYKTLLRLHRARARRPCLQFPEGLLVWGESVALIIEEFGDGVEEVVIMGDVTYGACCVDDVKARSLGCDFLVHYAHSCLVPVDAVLIPCLYVFVEISLNPRALAKSIVNALPRALPGALPGARAEAAEKRQVAVMGTIQFSPSVHAAARIIQTEYWPEDCLYIPQCLPLTAGETLGCTAPTLDPETKICVFVADGRFHVEAAMMENAHVAFFRYDPFTKRMFRERYDHAQMLTHRNGAIGAARTKSTFVIILSTLGRQGSVGLAEHVREQVLRHKPEARVLTLLLAELVPETLQRLATPSTCFVNVGCPRLAIDWSADFSKQTPILTSFEVLHALKATGPISKHPMDYFALNAGDWTNYGRAGRDGSLTPAAVDRLTELKRRWAQRKFHVQNAAAS